jgi:cell wall-associated NlpC family hydrolase
MVRGQSVGARAAAVALQQLGVPYRYGGATTSGFDCSGLVQFSYRQAGKRVPRTTGQLWSSTATVSREGLQEGDLLFFSIEGKMSHVGMYIGRQQFVHAPSSGRTVTVAKLTSAFYEAAFLRAGRPR